MLSERGCVTSVAQRFAEARAFRETRRHYWRIALVSGVQIGPARTNLVCGRGVLVDDDDEKMDRFWECIGDMWD